MHPWEKKVCSPPSCAKGAARWHDVLLVKGSSFRWHLWESTQHWYFQNTENVSVVLSGVFQHVTWTVRLFSFFFLFPLTTQGPKCLFYQFLSSTPRPVFCCTVVQESLGGPHHSIIVKIINNIFKNSAKPVTTLELLACLGEFLVKEMQAQD